jgi:transposase
MVLFPPKQLIGMNEWSLPKLRDYLIAEGVGESISLDHLGTLLRQLKVRWRRTKAWKESTAPDFWGKYRAIRRLYQHPSKDGRVICVDEFGPLNLQPGHGTCYAHNGKVKRYGATYNRKLAVRHFLAYYHLTTDRLYGRMTKHKKLPDLMSFMKWVRRRYPIGQTLHVVLDNYGTHCSHELTEWAKRHNVRLYFTPTNASWLNRIQCHFAPLKKFALANSDQRTHQEQDKAIQNYLLWRNRHRSINIQSYAEVRKCAA